MPIRWLGDGADVEAVGGKAASLDALARNDLPVPPAFVVSADTFRQFLVDAGLESRLASALDVDPDDAAAVQSAADTAQSLVRDAAVPAHVREAILASYDELCDHDGLGEHRGHDDLPVAVRSSATAEDLPDASFAGQQETYLNVSRDALVERVTDCWASAFTARAITYRNQQGFDHAAVDMAVVVQAMVDAEMSGVCFTSDPSTGEPRLVLEAAWGLGEAVVSGEVTPDTYVVDREEERLVETRVSDQSTYLTRSPDTGETVSLEVPAERRDARVLTDDEIDRLVDLAETIESHYGCPQDVEWAIADGSIHLLQSRPITTIEDEGEADAEAEDEGADVEREAASEHTDDPTTADGVTTDDTAGEGTPIGATDGGAVANDATGTATGDDADGGTGADDIIVDGLGAGPGTATGRARIVTSLDELDRVEQGDVLVTEMTTPDMVTAMQRAVGLITDEGGMTCHAAIVARELGVPAVVGTGDATDTIEDGTPVRLDGSTGLVTMAKSEPSGTETGDIDGTEAEGVDATDGPATGSTQPTEAPGTDVPTTPPTATRVKVNLSIPAAAERAATTGADGVGLLRTEHMILSSGETPAHYVEHHGADAYERELVDGIRQVAEAFYPRPVRVRTLDAPTDEFRELEGGGDEPAEHNPMLGYRGIRRSLDEPDLFEHELAAFRRLYEMGYDNVEIMFPIVVDADDALAAKAHLEAVGIDPEVRTWGVMIETPASALTVADLCETGLDFVSFGTNDLTQYTLALDRNNERVAERFDECHPAVLSLIDRVIETCRERDVETSICGQAASRPEMIRHLVSAGITSLSVNVDAVAEAQHEAMRVEQRCMLDAVRDGPSTRDD